MSRLMVKSSMQWLRSKNLGRALIFVTSLVSLQGCNSLAFTNTKLTKATQHLDSKASFTLKEDRGQLAKNGAEKTLFVLALSGGGSRAAVWSASAMLKLQTIFKDEGVDLLSEVDAISSISGGSMAAAYYAVSADSEEDATTGISKGKRPIWKDGDVQNALSKKFLYRWVGSWFLPHNMVRYWLTAYDRTDIMAETFADNLFDTSFGHDFTLGEINQNRPNIIINATTSSGKDFAGGFSFTDDVFQKRLCSDVNDYEVARAVMGSASFPAAFNSMTLKNHGFPSKDNKGCVVDDNDTSESFLHVIDGGSYDNLGLDSAIKFLRQNDDDYDRVAVILVDAYVPPSGASPTSPNPRGLSDYIIDTNFLDSVNTLMDRNRVEVINKMRKYKDEVTHNALDGNKKQVEFYHATFASIPPKLKSSRAGHGLVKDRINRIKTSLVISKDGQRAIDDATEFLFNKNNTCLQRIAKLIKGETLTPLDYKSTSCYWGG